MRRDEAVPAIEGEKIVIADITMSVVTERHVPIFSGFSGSWGDVVNANLEEAAMNGDTVTSFTLDIPKETWDKFAKSVNR